MFYHVKIRSFAIRKTQAIKGQPMWHILVAMFYHVKVCSFAMRKTQAIKGQLKRHMSPGF